LIAELTIRRVLSLILSCDFIADFTASLISSRSMDGLLIVRLETRRIVDAVPRLVPALLTAVAARTM
jgi:hypothetical protein